jgi:hypothetical protein
MVNIILERGKPHIFQRITGGDENARLWVLFLALSTERLRPDLTIRGVCVGIDEEELQQAVDGFKTQLTPRALAQIE